MILFFRTNEFVKDLGRMFIKKRRIIRTNYDTIYTGVTVSLPQPRNPRGNIFLSHQRTLKKNSPMIFTSIKYTPKRISRHSITSLFMCTKTIHTGLPLFGVSSTVFSKKIIRSGPMQNVLCSSPRNKANISVVSQQSLMMPIIKQLQKK